jgi:5-(carboxyamino)imidazole ribonucleotide mutase
MATPLVGIVMGSASDWPVMLHAANRLTHFGVPCESRVISAHRSPALAHEYATTAEKRGLKCIIAAAGMAAHLAGVMAAGTTIPVLGVPMPGGHLQGMDALLSTVQMPAGIPVATFAIGDAGAHNAALFAVSMLARYDKSLAEKLKEFRQEQEEKIKKIDLEGHI